MNPYLHEITTFPNSKYKDQADSTSQALAWINSQPVKPAIIEFTRRELARRMHENGLPLETIAMHVDSTPEEVQEWLNDYKESAARIREHLEPRYAGRCKKCGEPIPFNVQCIEVGSDMYYVGCWQS